MAEVYANGERAVDHAESRQHTQTGESLLAATRHEDLNHHDEVKSFLNEQVPDYCKRVAALAGRPEAADMMAWIKEQAKDPDNHLFRILASQMA